MAVDEVVTVMDAGQPPVPPTNPEEQSDQRNARRMTVDQLRRSIPLLFGGATWTTTFQGREVGLFDGLSRTLGEADYLEVTTPNTDPGPLFQKFMDDMAANLCTKGVQQDLESNAAEEKLVVKYPDNLDANLRFLRLKFHGIYIDEQQSTETDGLDDLRGLFEDLANDHDTETAWIGICMAFLTAPEFLAY